MAFSPCELAFTWRAVRPRTRRGNSATTPTVLQKGRSVKAAHSEKEKRYIRKVCGRTFAATKGRGFDWLATPADIVVLVMTLLAHGWPSRRLWRPSASTSARWPTGRGAPGSIAIRCMKPL